MTSLNTQLWELIKTHKMPDDADGTPFIEQLMNENSISQETATVAISEYLKFMYICATRRERNVPSKAVDLVWHLHMQHSRDYWDVFCQKLGKPVHHNPGGNGVGHLEDYKATVAAYRPLFGSPPKGIWRQNNRLQNYIGLITIATFAVAGAAAVHGGEPDGIFALGAAMFMSASTYKRFTKKGEFTLIFGCDDPFADDDAGDCGSGDCGGCGD
ncbi:hypothetical protein [Yoonia sp. BS5-3]|uniref:Uncharacterized protein n=1 Tax=Yoonia phaeophyticola TaxID=3137369 RepID=A0ABZ2V2M0_9RHOB